MTEFCADIDKLFTELPFEQRFKAARNEGFSSVEFEMPKKIGLGKLGDLCAVDGLKAAVLSVPVKDAVLAYTPYAFDAFCEMFEKVAETADFIEAPFIYLPPVDVTEKDFEKAQENFDSCMKEAQEILKSYRKKLLFGFSNPIETPDSYPSSTLDVVDILDDFDDDRSFGMLLDVYETQTGEGGLSNVIETLLPLIGHIRIAGVPLRNEPDDGEVNFTYLLALLEAHGYARAVSASYTPRAKTQAGLKWLKKYL